MLINKKVCVPLEPRVKRPLNIAQNATTAMEKFYVIMRKDLSSCLYESDELITSRNLYAIQQIAKTFSGIVKTYDEAKEILSRTVGQGD